MTPYVFSRRCTPHHPHLARTAFLPHCCCLHSWVWALMPQEKPRYTISSACWGAPVTHNVLAPASPICSPAATHKVDTNAAAAHLSIIFLHALPRLHGQPDSTIVSAWLVSVITYAMLASERPICPPWFHAQDSCHHRYLSEDSHLTAWFSSAVDCHRTSFTSGTAPTTIAARLLIPFLKFLSSQPKRSSNYRNYVNWQ